MLHAKAVTAEGRKAEGPIAASATCIKWADGEGELELSADVPSVSASTFAFTQAQLWQWTLSANSQKNRVTGDGVEMSVGKRCIAEIAPQTGALQSVQALPRLTGRLASRASPQVGQIEPDETSKAIAGAKVYLRLSEVHEAHQLPALEERVEFHLAPHPERADRLWAAEVTPLDDNSLARQPISRAGGALPEVDSKPAVPPPVDTAGGGGGPPSTQSPHPTRAYQSGCRVYVGKLAAEATWRELQELFAGFGELLHVQLPLDEKGRRRGYGVIELEKPEAAAAAVDKLQLAEIKGQQVVIRDDDSVVHARAQALVYCGNLSPGVTWQTLKEHLRPVDASGAAHVRVIADAHGASMGFGLVEFRTQAAADAAVWTLHNSMLDGRMLFMRQECDMNDQDGGEAAARRETHAKAVGIIAQVSAWVEAAPPLVEWGWSELVASTWTGAAAGTALPSGGGSRGTNLLAMRLKTRLRKLLTGRMELSTLQTQYERQFHERIEQGYPTVRDALASVSNIAIDTQGSRVYVSPAGGGGGGGGERRSRKDDRGRERDRDRDRERDEPRSRDDRRRDDRRRDDRKSDSRRDDRRDDRRERERDRSRDDRR